MDSLTAVAASGLRSRSRELESISINLSNANTNGYKAYGFHHEAYSQPGDVSPFSSVLEEKPSTSGGEFFDSTTGSLRHSGAQDDLAVRGEGYLVLRSENGELLGRGGKIAVRPGGELATQAGQIYLGADRKPIRIDPTKAFTIGQSGQVLQDGHQIGAFLVVSPGANSKLARTSHGTFAVEGGGASLVRSGAQVVQGAVEESNVNPVEESTRLVRVLREFESMQRALQMGTEMARSVFDHVAKV
jgi:flagellar basal body rod protein FlgG